MSEGVGQQMRLVRERIVSACARVGRSASEVTLVVVTKTATREQIREAVEAGAEALGENRVQVLEQHAAELREDMPDAQVAWHMIGHLQRNKVRQVLPLVKMVQSIDSLRLANEVDAVAGKMGVKMPVLLEVNAAEEPQKYGVAVHDVPPLVREVGKLPGIELAGIMCMAPYTEDVGLIRRTFASTRQLFHRVREEGIAGESWRHLSMGMSHDFEIAVEEGATIVRVGSLIFQGAGA